MSPNAPETGTIVFLGPSLPRAEAEAILDARYLPPARRGDIVAAVRAHRPETVALIDGYFEQVPSVWHKEILWALSQGIRVCGAASMGALRAAELAQFGMIGAGRVFEAYRTGRFAPFDEAFEDDDEVAVVHGPEDVGYLATEALVDIRATLAAAADAGVLAIAERDAVAAAAKALFYKRRTWGAVLEAARSALGARSFLCMAEWLPENRVRQKAMDAALLLGRVRDGPPAPAPPPFRFERTLLWQAAVGGSG
jgi:hypothetical protein